MVAGVNWVNLRFRFAKTMPEIPHEYVVRSSVNENDYIELFDIIRREGRIEEWRGRLYRYWYRGDGYKYWAMTSDLALSEVINRAKVEDVGSELPGDDVV
jgi:hypothetical protein